MRIGANYSNSLDQVLNPGNGPDGSDGYYIPGADGSMSCADLKTNFDKVENQMRYWFGILQTGNNSNKEKENLNKIINALQSKKDYYSTIMLRNCSIAPETKDPGTVPDISTDPGGNPINSGSPSTSNTAIAVGLVAVGLGGLYLLSRRKKSRSKGKGASKRSVKGVERNDLLIAGSLLATGIAVRISTKRKVTPEVQQQPEVDLTNQPGETEAPEDLPLPFDQMPILNDYTDQFTRQILPMQR